MLVKNWMSKSVITIDVNDSIYGAKKLLKEHHIHMLPVMEKEKLVGIITVGDLKKASVSNANKLEIHEPLHPLSEVKIGEIMTKNPVTVPLDSTVDGTIEILFEKQISGVPVVDHDGQLVGIITKSDIFQILISLIGINSKGIQFAFLLEERSGAIREVTDIIRRYGGRIVSILSSYKGVRDGYRKVLIQIYEIDRVKLLNIKEALKEKAILLYLINHQEHETELYEEEQRAFM